MSLHEAKECGCSKEIGMSKARTAQVCEHGNVYRYVKALGSKPASPTKPRKPLKRGRGFAVDPKQRDKVAGLPCVGCSRDPDVDVGDGTTAEYFAVDPAHLWPRGMGGCDHPDCVIPLCRTCHRKLDDPSEVFDLLSKLVDRGYWAELAHPTAVHDVSPLTLLRRLTGEDWAPLESPSGVVG
jgi:hypothetical protein